MKLTQTQRRAIRDEYRDRWGGLCELALWLGVRWTTHGAIRFESGRPGEVIQSVECHHIYHVGGRYDVFSNLIDISSSAHWLIHNGVRGEAQWVPMLCWLAKLRAAAKHGPEYFNLAEIDAVIGGGGLIGRIECMSFGRADLREWHSELVERLRRLAKDAAA